MKQLSETVSRKGVFIRLSCLFFFPVGFFGNPKTLHVISSHSSLQENAGCHVDSSETGIFYSTHARTPRRIFVNWSAKGGWAGELVCSLIWSCLAQAVCRLQVGCKPEQHRENKTELCGSIKSQSNILLDPLFNNKKKKTTYSCFK